MSNPTSWLSFLVSYCEFVTFPLASWFRCGTWLYWFLIFAPFLTLMQMAAVRRRRNKVYFNCFFEGKLLIDHYNSDSHIQNFHFHKTKFPTVYPTIYLPNWKFWIQLYLNWSTFYLGYHCLQKWLACRGFPVFKQLILKTMAIFSQ